MLDKLLIDKKGDIKTATLYLKKSLAILQKIGSPSAQTVQNIIDRITGRGE